VIDIPVVKLTIIEYELHRLCCPGCGHWTRAKLPAGVGQSSFGPRVHALVAVLVGKFRQGKRGAQGLLALVFDLDVSLGAISKMERRVSAALETPVAEVQAAIQKAEVVHKDETSWRQLKDKAWLWLAATGQMVGFWIDRRRGSEVSKRILGEDFTGIVCCDRWSAYLWLSRRAFCWAHLKRDFVAMVERHNSRWHGERLVNLTEEIMALWARWRAGEIDRVTMEAEVAPLKARMEQMLVWTAANAPGPKARATARNLLKDQPAMWRWLTDERVALTNNLAERLLRYAVIWRKLSYGTDSLAGSRYVERLLTAVGTLQLQGRDAYVYLTELMTAYTAGQPLPSLLPQESDNP
jgi:transposase